MIPKTKGHSTDGDKIDYICTQGNHICNGNDNWMKIYENGYG